MNIITKNDIMNFITKNDIMNVITKNDITIIMTKTVNIQDVINSNAIISGL